MKNVSKLLVLTVGSMLLVACVEDGVNSATYTTRSSPPRGYATGAYSDGNDRPPSPYTAPAQRSYQTGSSSRAVPVEGVSSGSGGYMTDAQ